MKKFTDYKIMIMLILHLISCSSLAQNSNEMEKIFINTTLGEIAVFHNSIQSDKPPILFLHGVYFDHKLWENQILKITDRPVIAIDMPFHGESKRIAIKEWSLNDCADMLLEILDSLKYEKVIAIGHSWGSMTILRAQHKSPEYFSGIGLCNMPFEAPSNKEKWQIKFQHTALLFRGFYMKQAGKALFSKETLSQSPELLEKLITPMSKLSNKQIRHTDLAVRVNSGSATQMLENVHQNTIALIGEEDYVGIPPIEKVIKVKGGHISPLEATNEVNKMISQLSSL